MKMKKIGYLFLPTLFLIYLIVDTFLKLNHSSLCHTRGCELAAGLIDIPASYLNFLGIFDALIILLLGILTYKRFIDKKYFYFFIFISIIFESIMIGYQFFASPELCKFCLGVYSFLILIAIFTSSEYILTFLGAIFVIFTALYILAIPKQVPFVTIDNINYLIQSPTCPHCKKVKKFLKEHNIPFTKINAKKIEVRGFVKFLNFKTIPILIRKNGPKVQIINGDKDIIDFFNNQKEEKIVKNTNKKEIPIEDIVTPSEDSGCEISIFEKPACTAAKKPNQ